MTRRLALTNARLIDPEAGAERRGDLLIAGGRNKGIDLSALVAGRGSVAAVVGYLTLVVGAGLLLPAGADVSGFPAATLWEFRTASLVVQATLWAVLGVVLTGLVGRLAADARRDLARRTLAASL